MRRPQFSLKTLLWLMLTTALASVEVPRLWRAVFPRQRIIEFSAAQELDDDRCMMYTLFEDGTFEREQFATDSLVPPAVPEDQANAEPEPALKP